MIGLYVHFPFCETKCPYCDFYSVTTGVYADAESVICSYAEAVTRNIEHYGERYDSIFFGGGTPSLGWRYICDILGAARFADGSEITVEMNPGSVSVEMLTALRDCGVNRLSIGAQSFANNELSALGRRHGALQSSSAVRLAGEAGFRNISVDLMLGIPHQTPESVRRSVKILSALPVTHVSAYMLKIEPHTPFAKMNISLPDDEKTALIYLTAVKSLEENGFAQYEISNFAKPGFECRHNLKYWESKEYLGIGASAHSYYGGKRFAVENDIKAFIKSDIQKVIYTDLSPRGFSDYAMLKLRLNKGLTFQECADFGIEKSELISRTALIPPKYIEVNEEGIRLTAEGFLVSNQIIGKLI